MHQPRPGLMGGLCSPAMLEQGALYGHADLAILWWSHQPTLALSMLDMPSWQFCRIFHRITARGAVIRNFVGLN